MPRPYGRGMNNRTADMVGTHPVEPSLDGQLLSRVLTALQECISICTLCADACLHEPDVTELRVCITLNQDCAAVCQATAEVLGRFAPAGVDVMAAQLRACIDICNACAEECSRHAGHMRHCEVCAEACRDCAAVCTEALDGLEA